MKIRVFEAFAGYGSQSIALKLLAENFPGFEFEVVGISEIDRYAIQAYRALHGDAALNLGDITKINWKQFNSDIDLLTYSFPCQDISSAGLQRGLSKGSGTRSSCLWACANAIEEKHPKFILMENVKALTQQKFSHDFGKWREWLRSQGYRNYYTVLNAKDYGVPQNRERVFMVSIRAEHSPFYFPAPFTLERRLRHVLEEFVDEKYWLTPKQIETLMRHNERKQAEGCGFKTNFQGGDGISGAIKTKEGSREYDTYIKVPTYGNSRLNDMIRAGQIDPTKTMWIDAYNKRIDEDVAGTILARINATGHYLVSDPRACAMRGRPDESGRNHQQLEFGTDIANTITSVQKDSLVADPCIIQVGNLIEDSNYSNPQRGRLYSAEGLAPCLNCCGGGQLGPKIVQPSDDSYPQRGRVYCVEGIEDVKIFQCGHGFTKDRIYTEYSPALISSKWQDNHFAIIEYWIRKLTPRECFRLMDVPEPMIDTLLKAGISNSQLYKLAGNSIVVACLYHIFRKMFIEFAMESGSPQCSGRYEGQEVKQLSLF